MAATSPASYVGSALVHQVDKVKISLVFFFVGVLLTANGTLVHERPLIGFAVSFSALLVIWSYYLLRWEELQAQGQWQVVATVFTVLDLGVIAVFVEATGGFRSPFWALLLLPLIFAAIYFSQARLAVPLTAALVTCVYLAESNEMGGWRHNEWDLLGRLIVVAAVAWLSWLLSSVLYRERQAHEVMAQHLAAGVLVLQGADRVFLANPELARLLSWPQTPAAGQSLLELPAGPGTELLREVVGAICRPEARPVDREMSGDGHPRRYLRFYATPWSQAEAGGWVLTVEDVTEIRAVTSTKEKSLSLLSHELRSPLTSMRGLARTLAGKAGELTPEERRHATRCLEAESDRLSRLVNTLLDVSHLEQGKAELCLQAVSLAEISARIRELYTARACEKRISLLSEVPLDLPPVRADADRLEQILVALLDNALKYTPRGGTIRLQGCRQEGHAGLIVSDTGRGIPEAAQEMVFERFGRVPSEREYPFGEPGLGLGLYLARLLAREQGGDLLLDSTLGGGSSFTVLLPLRRPAERRADTAAIA
ncbi:MAG TPA: ATP-binding protein [Armatimonadota bacterium]|jgi:signal transduction histidine kinase